METKSLNIGMEWSNYEVIAKEEFEQVFSFPTQLPLLDFSSGISSSGWEFGMQESEMLDVVPIAQEMFLNEPFYSAFDLLPYHTNFQKDFFFDSGSTFGLSNESMTSEQLDNNNSSRGKELMLPIIIEEGKKLVKSNAFEKHDFTVFLHANNTSGKRTQCGINPFEEKV
ncbi:hypothetical protein ACJIZ3_005366 [Penstemon smallii]|uniref:Uncharacterized protein n=1 Tax=Penstemon smallii TaxID=265156 RepID=A0ABD3S4U0_9LAMI